MSAVRLNITVSEDLANKLNRIAGARRKSQFISDAVKEKIEKIQHEELQKALEGGYKSRKKESLSMTEEFEFVDLEGWDEY